MSGHSVEAVKNSGIKRLKLNHIVLIDNNKMFFCLLAACAAHCVTCSAATKCDTCETGYIVNSDNTGCAGQYFFVPSLKDLVKFNNFISNLNYIYTLQKVTYYSNNYLTLFVTILKTFVVL